MTTHPFGEVIDFQEGPGIMAVDFRDDGVPLIRLAGLSSSDSVLDGCNYLEPQMVEKKWRHFRLSEGDTLLSTSAALGRVAVVDAAAEGAIAYTGIIRMRPRNDFLDAGFIRYLLLGSEFQRQAEAVGVGSVMRHFGPSHLRTMSVTIPSRANQRKIAAILSAYDDLIENNSRRIALLEEMAERIYREWFVEFRYPGHDDIPLVASELGPIPEGWGVGTLGSLVAVNANTIRGVDADEVIRYIDIASVARGVVQQPKQMRLGDAPGRARRRVVSGDVLWSTVRPNLRAHALVLSSADDIVASTGFVVLSPRRASFAYIYALTTTDEFVEYLSGRATGSAYPAVTPPAFESAPTILPPPDVLGAFADVAEPLMRRASCASVTNELLRASRDLLLPRLISGEIDVTDLDIDVMDVAA